MVYRWEDLNTGRIVEVERPVNLMEEMPTYEECKDRWTKEEFEAAIWDRLFIGGSASKGFGQKGRW